ncbi:MAG: TadE/TadG family type IV pilus assembly protein [Acidimicrobiia bacterium]
MIQGQTQQPEPGNHDKGASAVLIALSMVVLMGFAAIAVDAGIAFEDRRQQQSAADVGALAALQFAKTGLSTVNCGAFSGADRAACRGAEEAMDVVEGTLPGRYGLAEWAACLDASKPAEFTQGSTSSGSPCINFTRNFQKVRVVLPGTDVDTAFARVIGFNSIAVSALAEAGLDLNQSADVLPWAVGPTGNGFNYACLMANSTSNLDVDPCNGPTQGNFGKLDMALYGNTSIETPEICGNAQPRTKMGVNLIAGSDHPLEEFDAIPGNVHDFTNCPIMTNPVDQLRTQPGNAANGIEDGLFLGVTETTPDYEGRLLCKTTEPDEFGGFISKDCVLVGNQFPEQVDHTPLWDFIASGVNAELNPSGKCSGVNTSVKMQECLQAWRDYGPAHTISLFKTGLETAPRFAAIPILDSDPSNGSGDYLITAFKPIYLDTVYLKCNSKTCDIVHSPGYDNAGPCLDPLTPTDKSCGWTETGKKGIVAVTSYMLTIDMLPLNIQEDFPASEGTIIFNLSK